MRPKSLEDYLAQLGSGEFVSTAEPELPPIPLRPDYVPEPVPEPIITKPPPPPRNPAELKAPAVPAIAPETPSDVVKATIAARHGFGEGMDAASLKAAQQAANERIRSAQLNQAGADIGHAIARLPGKADTGYWDKEMQLANKGVTDLAQLRQATMQDQEMGRAQRKYAIEDENNNPNSPKAAIYRNTLAKLWNKDPATLKGYSFNELKDVVDDQLRSEAGLKSSENLRYAMIGSQREGRAAAKEAREEEKAKLTDKQVDAVTEFDTTIANTRAALDALKDDFTGRVRGRVPDIMVNDPQEAAFRAEVGRITDAYRKLITGAGASVQELRRLESRLPSVTDPPDIFRRKAEDFMAEVERGKSIYLENQAKKGKNVSNFRSTETPTRSSGGTKPPGMSQERWNRLQELRSKQ